MFTTNNPTLLRLKHIIGDKKQGITPILPVSRSAFLNGVKAGRYPKPVCIGEKSVAWRYSDIMALINSLEVAA
jgi:prophage regulatory protein